MTLKGKYTPRIQLLANRVRCSLCNTDSSECVFLISDELQCRYSFRRAKLQEPFFFKGNPERLRINKVQRLESKKMLTRICLRCGTIRKASIPNN
jgi:hypothetical protein